MTKYSYIFKIGKSYITKNSIEFPYPLLTPFLDGALVCDSWDMVQRLKKVKSWWTHHDIITIQVTETY